MVRILVAGSGYGGYQRSQIRRDREDAVSTLKEYLFPPGTDPVDTE